MTRSKKRGKKCLTQVPVLFFVEIVKNCVVLEHVPVDDVEAPHVAGVVVVHPQELVMRGHAAGLGLGVHTAHEERAAELVEILVGRQSSQQAVVDFAITSLVVAFSYHGTKAL